jgi:hypothetical protein
MQSEYAEPAEMMCDPSSKARRMCLQGCDEGHVHIKIQSGAPRNYARLLPSVHLALRAERPVAIISFDVHRSKEYTTRRRSPQCDFALHPLIHELEKFPAEGGDTVYGRPTCASGVNASSAPLVLLDDTSLRSLVTDPLPLLYDMMRSLVRACQLNLIWNGSGTYTSAVLRVKNATRSSVTPTSSPRLSRPKTRWSVQSWYSPIATGLYLLPAIPTLKTVAVSCPYPLVAVFMP